MFRFEHYLSDNGWEFKNSDRYLFEYHKGDEAIKFDRGWVTKKPLRTIINYPVFSDIPNSEEQAIKFLKTWEGVYNGET